MTLPAPPAPGRPCTTAPGLYFSRIEADLARAKQLCSWCPVRERCLKGAVARREPWGVWGGVIFDRGRPVDERRQPGRPKVVAQ